MSGNNYYYGQGRVYLSPCINGVANAWRWVGDVGELTVELTHETQYQKQSINGRIGNIDNHIVSQEGVMKAVWFDRSPANLALLLYGKNVVRSARAISETLRPGVKAGGRYTLEYSSVWDVSISGLTAGTDYTVDERWGAIEFLKTPIVQPVTVKYKHAGNTSIPLLNEPPHKVALRYEGVNLAENEAPVLVELFRLQFDPVGVIDLINNDSALSGLEVQADVLLDISRSPHDVFGQYGRYVICPVMDSSSGTLTITTTTAGYGGEITTIYPK
ncbi:hypothetical protein [Leminorella grimontii]|uniref:phage tail tube protein n=1 Tax=Leminorella grimontii TaxID=82981 RepID=UPI0032203F61